VALGDVRHRHARQNQSYSKLPLGLIFAKCHLCLPSNPNIAPNHDMMIPFFRDESERLHYVRRSLR
jgi:hypothetical protein